MRKSSDLLGEQTENGIHQYKTEEKHAKNGLLSGVWLRAGRLYRIVGGIALLDRANAFPTACSKLFISRWRDLRASISRAMRIPFARRGEKEAYK